MRELTAMQAANWFGRGADVALGGVSAHLYAEFDGHALDLQRLSAALEQVCLTHSMLRLQVTADGMQVIAPSDRTPRLEVDDFTAMHAPDLERALLNKRIHWTHQKLDLTIGQASRFSVTLLPNDAFRLHIDTDMVAVDPSSFQRLMEDLALVYENKDATIAPLPSFFDWYDKMQADAQLKARRDKDRSWWRERLSQIAPAPSLPLQMSASEGACSHRLSTWLQPDEHQTLRRLAREQRITFSSMMLGLFAMVLGNATGDRMFRLNVPLFWRQPLVNDVERIVGDFVNLVILDVDLTIADDLGALCQDLASQMIELLGHSAYSGVNLMRDLSRHHGSPQLSPVVFTAALDLPDGDLFSPCVQRAFGTMSWAISQGPQVALDAQIASFEGGILINWDVRLDALPGEWVTKLFDSFVALLKDAVDDQGVMARPVKPARALSSSSEVEQPLTPMQRAYLFGRTAQLPLGGVAMQEFREYRGVMDPALLRSRLAEMVRRHKSLRTLIDAEKLVKVVNDLALPNLQEIDLTELSSQDALKQVQEYRDIYSHSIFDLSRSPWNITIYRLKNDLLIVFVRFDALILDGQSISALLVELFEGRSPILESIQKDSSNPEDLATLHKVDAAYWKAKLLGISDTAQLPWSMPLAQLSTSRYERQSITINREVFKQLCRTGAKQGLFKNSTVMALILEVLGHWNARKKLCVAIPVMPLYAETFSSSSTFIAIGWDIGHDSFANRAARLQADVLEGLNHLSFSGVDLTRLLFENCGRSPVLPVVITNGLSWPSLSEAGPMKLCNGLTQTPQVAIDIRFVAAPDGSLVFDIDYARDAIASAVINGLLRDIQKAIKQLDEPTNFSIDTSEFTRISNDSKSNCKYPIFNTPHT
ncbi:hypothetical protein CAP48_11415 [Advenella sp. S44]|uniref:condensation domain-containing protein n=1 Tax=Advenella sp. S44 TaxID=1982755 RepID=UPI000C2A7C40|nr:condensation domain-containing protein [Advenella sp. S44]PJX24106.1 hypothetical protein CAP48_11415 [Advenella sp. S44]